MKRECGFTLLEVLVALVIIGVALAAAMRGAMALTSSAEYTREKMLAIMVPLSEGDIQLTFANVPYGAWATWLAGIERELGARATSVVVTGKEGTPGNVDAELALRLARK